MTTFNIFHTTRVRVGVRDAPHMWGAGEIRDAGERRLFGGLARSEPFVTPQIWGTGEMSTETSALYLGHWGNKHWKSRRIYVALGHDELIAKHGGNPVMSPCLCHHDDGRWPASNRYQANGHKLDDQTVTIASHKSDSVKNYHNTSNKLTVFEIS